MKERLTDLLLEFYYAHVTPSAASNTTSSLRRQLRRGGVSGRKWNEKDSSIVTWLASYLGSANIKE
jgi:hypothetical protein